MRRLFIVGMTLLLLAPLASAQAPVRQHLAQRVSQVEFPPIPAGYEQILPSPGFESWEGNWYQYRIYPIEAEGLIECDLFAAEGNCYAWLCAQDGCYHEVRQPLYVRGWQDLHMDYAYHVETQEPPESDPYTDKGELYILDSSLTGRLVQYVYGWGNQHATNDWTYGYLDIGDPVWWPDWVNVVFSAYTNNDSWSGFYLDGIRLWGIPPHRSYQPMFVR